MLTEQQMLLHVRNDQEGKDETRYVFAGQQTVQDFVKVKEKGPNWKT